MRFRQMCHVVLSSGCEEFYHPKHGWTEGWRDVARSLKLAQKLDRFSLSTVYTFLLSLFGGFCGDTSWCGYKLCEHAADYYGLQAAFVQNCASDGTSQSI